MLAWSVCSTLLSVPLTKFDRAHAVLLSITRSAARQEAILTEYQNMLARLSTIFAQQKALVTRLSRPLPMTPDDINVVRAGVGCRFRDRAG